MKENFRLLHEKAKQIAQCFRKAQADLIDILQRIDHCKGFRLLGYPSLYQYALDELGLSEANASNFITVARKSNEIPQLKEEISQGNISVSKARKITPVIDQSNAQDWLLLAKTLPQKKLEQQVAKVMPKLATKEKSHYVSEDRLQLQVGVSEELLKRIKRIQDLLSQQTKKPISIEEALEEMSREYIKRHDPLEKARRSNNKNSKADSTIVSVLRQTIKRIPLSANMKNQVLLREQGQCSFIDKKNHRCQNKRWLEIDHMIPVKEGGLNQLDNLQLLCFSHHKLKHTIQATQKALLAREKAVQ